MMSFTVRPPGHTPLHFIINPEKACMESNMPPDAVIIQNPKMCHKCHKSKLTDNCNLLQALIPILVYFSDFLSYEEVVVEYHEGSTTAHFVESAQRAGFVLCLYAMYWLAEGAYQRGDYKAAIAEFDKVAKGWPGHHKAADALYKLAQVQEKSGDVAGARASLERYLRDYPNAELAGAARQKLQALPK